MKEKPQEYHLRPSLSQSGLRAQSQSKFETSSLNFGTAPRPFGIPHQGAESVRKVVGKSVESLSHRKLPLMNKFCNDFKRQRLEYGYSQADVALSISRRFGTDLSQTTISRFEAYNLSPKNMFKLKPIFESWIAQATESFRRGICAQNFLQSDIVAAQGRAKAVGMDLNMILPDESSNPAGPTQSDFDQFRNYFDSPLDIPLPPDGAIVKAEPAGCQEAPPFPEFDGNVPYHCYPSPPPEASSLFMSQNQADIVNEFMSYPEDMSLLVNDKNSIQITEPAPVHEPIPVQIHDQNLSEVNNGSTKRRRNGTEKKRMAQEQPPMTPISVPIVFVPGDPIYVGRKRRKRTVLTDEQRNYLIDKFHQCPSPSASAITQIANELDLDRFVVRVWFANRRQSLKKRRMNGFDDDFFDGFHGRDTKGDQNEMNELSDNVVKFEELRPAKREDLQSAELFIPSIPYSPYSIQLDDHYVPNDPTIFHPPFAPQPMFPSGPPPPPIDGNEYFWNSMYHPFESY
uniref:POU domain protein n=1 Tax=Bursaphelenchus xylophilus TaxID=6326 RepID=A0A1I7RKN7_BURXY